MKIMCFIGVTRDAFLLGYFRLEVSTGVAVPVGKGTKGTGVYVYIVPLMLIL